MNLQRTCWSFLALLLVATTPTISQAVSLSYPGTDFDIGGTFFPGGGPANAQAYTVVPWRSDGAGNTFSASSEPGQRYYGRDGYALFSTRFDYPNANLVGGTNADWNDAFFAATFPDILSLPDFVTDSLVLANRRAGGYGYALVDDPQITAGYRDYNWGDNQSPPANPPHSQAPYVKIGVIGDWDRFGNYPANSAPEALPAGRWGFQVGADVPSNFRVGVLADGYNGAEFAPGEVFLSHVSALGTGAVILDSVSTGEIAKNRFVDIHFFDIVDAQEGDIFAFGVKSHSTNNVAAISGITFDILPTPPTLAGDYNRDGAVDGIDYSVWRESLGQSVTPGEGADGDDSGLIDTGDFTLWRQNYAGSAGSIPSASTPEPSTMVMFAMAAIGLAARRRLY